MSKFYLRIATPDGRAGFMRGALPRVSVVSAGYLEISDEGMRKRFDCGDGLLCVDGDGVTLITSRCADREQSTAGGADVKNAERAASDREHDYAKARVMSAVYKLKNKDSSDNV